MLTMNYLLKSPLIKQLFAEADTVFQGHSIQRDGKLLNFLLTSGLEHGPWRLAAANK